MQHRHPRDCIALNRFLKLLFASGGGTLHRAVTQQPLPRGRCGREPRVCPSASGDLISKAGARAPAMYDLSKAKRRKH